LKKVRGKFKASHHYSVHFYRDDFVQIINILSEISDQVEISDDDYVYESLDELISQKGLKPKKVFISSSSPYVSILLGHRFIWIYSRETDKESLYAYDRIREVLRKRRSILSRVINPGVAIFFSSVLWLFFILIPADLHKIIAPNDWTKASFFILLLGIPALSLFLRTGGFSSFTLIPFHEQNSFFSRQKDDLIKIAIGAIIGALLTLLVSRLN